MQHEALMELLNEITMQLTTVQLLLGFLIVVLVMPQVWPEEAVGRHALKNKHLPGRKSMATLQEEVRFWEDEKLMMVKKK